MAVDKIVWKIVLDFFILACVCFPLLALMLWAEPYHRGYFMSDESIMLPFKEQSISEAVLAAVGFIVVVILVIATEIFRGKRGTNVGQKFLSGNLVPGWVWESYATVGVFAFGAACQQLTANLSKYVIGRLRPHFLDVCRPIPNADPDQNMFGYIQNYTCSGNNTSLILEARLSFPSAHSSFAMYTAIFLICYIQVKCKWRGSKLLRHSLQFLLLLAAWYVGLSRVVEHKHHWSDVAAGFAVGTAYGLLVFIYVLKPKKYGVSPSWQEPGQLPPR